MVREVKKERDGCECKDMNETRRHLKVIDSVKEVCEVKKMRSERKIP